MPPTKYMTEFVADGFGKVQVFFTIRRYPGDDGTPNAGDMYADWVRIYANGEKMTPSGSSELPNQYSVLAPENLGAIHRSVNYFLTYLIFNQMDIESEVLQ